VWAVVVAGGTGSRFGRPKQFDLLAGRPVVEWAVAAARSVATGVVLVVPGGHGASAAFGADVVVEGGASRSASVRCGLDAVPERAEIVVVHDAARPLATPALFAAVVDPLRALGGEDATAGPGAARPPDAVVCAVPVADTLKRLFVDGVTVAATVDRSQLVAVQTPQAFRAGVLRRAHAASGEATDDAALVEEAGGVVVVVPGERHNLKLTVPEDLDVAEQLLARTALPAPRGAV
jgi:2-C-methyl-D-erythritol 4-phosphate cytidylyltransferase